MTTLAIDCSGKILNIALAADGSYWELIAEAGFRHGETLMSSVDALCSLACIAPGQIELVAVTGGPGSFTGLRIGMAAAKGLARGCGCPMKSVPTLEILAAGRSCRDGIIMPVMDARKGRVYAAAFQNGRRIVEDSDMNLEAFLAALPAGEKILATGPDAKVAAGRPGVTVDALHSAGRGRFIMETAWAALEKDGPDPHDRGPVYIRLSEAEEALVGGDMRQKASCNASLSEALRRRTSGAAGERTLPDDEECGSLKTWTDTQEIVDTPMAVLSSRLTIRWRNAAFKRFRETPGLEYLSRPFHALFSNFAEEEARQELIDALNSAQTGFSWQGRVKGRNPDGRQFIADLTVIPMDFDDSRPSWYLAQIFDVTDLVKSIVRANFDSILQASLLKDEDTGKHAERVNAYSRLLAARLKGRVEWLDVDDDYIENIGFLAAFHDVGKIGTPESILLKNGKLTDEEWRIMKEHPINGAIILDTHPSPMAKRIARSHHEHWDGTGYPFGLAGEDIPLEGRIVNIADVYDALRARRPYKEPFSEEKTVSIIQESAGTHFDPSLFREFVAIREQFDAVFRNLSDETP